MFGVHSNHASDQRLPFAGFMAWEVLPSRLLCRQRHTAGAPQAVPRSGAFTLVELLVVIAIVGMLVALLLPAVQAAREAARRTKCVSQLKEWSVGSISLHDLHGHFPTGGWGWSWLGDADRGFGHNQPGGWIYSLLPYVEMASLHQVPGDGDADTITPEQKRAARLLVETPLPLIHCPTRRSERVHAVDGGLGSFLINSDVPGSVARADYAMNAGTFRNQFDAGPSGIAPAQLSAYKWMDQQLPSHQLDGISYQRSEVTIAQVTDGTTFTLMVGEKAHVPSAYDDGSWGGDNETWSSGFNNDVYRIMHGDPTLDPARTIMFAGRFKGPLSDNDAEVEYERFDRDELRARVGRRFGSAHSNIWNAAFCDGSVHSLSYKIDSILLKSLASRFDGQIVDSSNF